MDMWAGLPVGGGDSPPGGGEGGGEDVIAGSGVPGSVHSVYVKLHYKCRD